jgi:hypothetical protein
MAIGSDITAQEGADFLGLTSGDTIRLAPESARLTRFMVGVRPCSVMSQSITCVVAVSTATSRGRPAWLARSESGFSRRAKVLPLPLTFSSEKSIANRR